MRGEDYWFHFTGRVRDGKHHFRLHMEYDGEGGPEDGTSKTIDFVYDPDVDTAGGGAGCLGRCRLGWRGALGVPTGSAAHPGVAGQQGGCSKSARRMPPLLLCRA